MSTIPGPKPVVPAPIPQEDVQTALLRAAIDIYQRGFRYSCSGGEGAVVLPLRSVTVAVVAVVGYDGSRVGWGWGWHSGLCAWVMFVIF